jgi:beta-glucanase (GH16 family)
MKRAVVGIAVVAAGLVFATPAHADPDTDFANELHTYGIYGQKDYHAWIGKIVCKRLYKGVDQDAYESAQFISINMEKGTTTEQSWQFLGAALRTYCPDQMPILENVAR